MNATYYQAVVFDDAGMEIHSLPRTTDKEWARLMAKDIVGGFRTMPNFGRVSVMITFESEFFT